MQKCHNPLQAAEQLMTLIGTARSASLSGPYGSGKSSALSCLVGAAVSSGLGLHEIAAYASTPLAIDRLRQLIGTRFACEPGDLFCDGLSGTLMEALRHHTAIISSDRALNIESVVNDFLAMITVANDLAKTPENAAFLQSMRPKVRDAIRLDIMRREHGGALPGLAFYHNVAETLARHKEDTGILDDADLVHGDYRTSRQVRLLLLDELDATPLRRAALLRLFPNAAIVETSRAARAADLALQLSDCLRRPERWDMIDSNPLPQHIPALPSDLSSLLIVAPPWRSGLWFGWLGSQGLPPAPHMAGWRAIVAAHRYDDEDAIDVPVKRLKPLLDRAGLTYDGDPTDWISRGDVVGWSSWRELGERYFPKAYAHAVAVLERFGRLTGLPRVRVSSADALRHDEAEVVIVDATGGLDADQTAIALSRATKRLITMQGERPSEKLAESQ
jgi:hypothetical protein